MSDKKHIDRLFQEKFKDFEVKPKANVWANIENELKQPKQKTVLIPLWLRYTGVAALLLLFFTVGNSFLNESSEEGNTVVDTTTESNKLRSTVNNDNTEETNTFNNEEAGSKSGNSNDTNNTIVVKNDEDGNNIESLEVNKTGNRNSSEAKQNKNEVIVSSSLLNDNASDKSYQNKKIANQDNNGETASNYSIQKSNNSVAINEQKSQTKVTSNKILDNKFSDNKKNQNSNSTINKNYVTKTESNDLIKDEIINPLNILNNTKTDALANTETLENENIKTTDSTNTNDTIENAIAKIEDLIEKEEEENAINRWTVNANVAPVYYNTLGKGSHIDEQFIDNPKNGEINTSYGVKVGYNVNKRLKVRSGVNKLNLSYDTANVIVYNSVSNEPNTAALRNINFVPDNQGQTFSVLSTDNLIVQQVSSVVNDNLNVALSQRMSYVEVPLELEYAVIDKKLGVNVIGGASAFFLSNNEVVSEIDNQKQKIGEANNINDISYSANLGLGIDYNFSDKLKFNFEPTFKYQMNAYSETSGNFRPYIIGVYTGFSYKF